MAKKPEQRYKATKKPVGKPKPPLPKKPARPVKRAETEPQRKRSAAQQPLRGGKRRPSVIKNSVTTTPSTEISSAPIRSSTPPSSPAVAAAPPAELQGSRRKDELREMLVCDMESSHEYNSSLGLEVGDACPGCMDDPSPGAVGTLELREAPVPPSDPTPASARTTQPRETVTTEGDEQRPDPQSTVSGPTGSGRTNGITVRGAGPASAQKSETGSVIAQSAPLSEKTPSGLAARIAANQAKQGPSDNSPHVEVPALAGTGKTTTVIEGCKEVKGIRSALTPSEQQRAVWEAMGAGKHDSIRVSSFAKKITDELKTRLDSCGLNRMGVDAQGIHSLGNAALTKRFGRCNADKAKWVVPDIVCGMLGKNLKDLKGTPESDMVWAVDSLVSLCKQTLTDPTPEGLDALASRYDVDLNGGRDKVFDLVPQVLEKCLIPANNQITFDDMIWLPLKHDLPIYKVDLQIVDESQDLNRMQQELIYRAGHRIVFVGDKHQAIYGFAGADAESMDHMRHTLGQQHFEGRGCITLPLTVTRRCGKAIVKEAQRYVPGYEAHESNPEGIITSARFEEGTPGQYREKVAAGDFVLCRCNAPLVSQCFRFIKAGRKATILGKKVGEGLTSLIEKSKKRTAPELISWLGDWLAKEQANENAKRYPSEGRLDNLQDRHDCILAFCEGQSEVAGVVAKINQVFTDNKDDRGITLSSIHKAKGLEARRVFILQPKGVGPRTDKMQEWELEQERNLKYVAITRAIEELIYVS